MRRHSDDSKNAPARCLRGPHRSPVRTGGHSSHLTQIRARHRAREALGAGHDDTELNDAGHDISPIGTPHERAPARSPTRLGASEAHTRTLARYSPLHDMLHARPSSPALADAQKTPDVNLFAQGGATADSGDEGCRAEAGVRQRTCWHSGRELAPPRRRQHHVFLPPLSERHLSARTLVVDATWHKGATGGASGARRGAQQASHPTGLRELAPRRRRPDAQAAGAAGRRARAATPSGRCRFTLAQVGEWGVQEPCVQFLFAFSHSCGVWRAAGEPPFPRLRARCLLAR